MKGKYRSTLLVLLVALSMSQSSIAARTVVGECGQLENAYGPFDYTNYEDYTTRLAIVEEEHFTHDVETLTKGNTTYLYGDLDYTLRAFPNHHRALISLSKYEFLAKQGHERLSQIDLGEFVGYSVECYFRRAVAFKPNDGMVRLIYAAYLHRKGYLDSAEEQYNIALDLNPDSAEVHYNLGLFYVGRNKLGLAVKHGHKAYELGYPLSGLKNKLIKMGVWDETVSQN